MRTLAVLLLAVVGCVEQPTQVLVRLATDIPDIDTVVIRIYDDEEALVREQVLPPDRLRLVPDDGRFHPIGTFGLVPQDGDSTRRFRVVVDVTVRREGTVRFETRARSGFVRNNSIRLDIFIAELCIDLAEMCEEEGLTCGIDGCVPEDVPPESLPPIDDDPIPDDPFDPRRFDGGMTLDAGVDDARSDGPVPDSMLDAPLVDGAVDTASDATFDAPFDGGADAGFDGGMLVPGMDDAPTLFPWSGFRFEGTVPKVVFRQVPGATRYVVTYRDYPAGGINELFVTDASPVVEYDITGLTIDPGGRRLLLQVRSCDGPGDIDCSIPRIPELYVDVGRVRCDLDNDGTSDVAVGQSNGSVHVWINGRTSPPQSLMPHSRTAPTVTACADLDGDGDSELVSMQAIAGPVGIIDDMGASLGTRASPFMASATTMTAGDFDADGFEDIVFADVAAGEVRYARGAAGPSLMAPQLIARIPELAGLVANPDGRFGRDLAVTDVNTDGFLDLIIADANDREDMTKSDSGLQISYGGQPPFMTHTFVAAVNGAERDEHFGWRVAGLGVSNAGTGGFVVAAPEGNGGLGRVYEYRRGANSESRVAVDAPDAVRGFCCFPNDLAPATRDYSDATLRYWAGFGDFENVGGTGSHRGRVYDCSAGACVAYDPPIAVDDSFFGFDVTGDLDANRVVGLGRMGAMNGLFALEGAIWRAFTASPSISAQSVLTD